MSLKDYKRKRDFKKTAEPIGKLGPRISRNRFVVQKHAASHLHYDFRLELDGTLKSWAVPKGMPFAKGEKRLAIQVEDHPVSYIDFEGTIPQGQYGGGTVMVWDRGTFEPLSASPLKELEGGKLHFVLTGKKLKGEWYLVQLHKSTQWLLIRAGDNLRAISKKLDDTSALSGNSMAQLAKGNAVWESGRKHTPSNESVDEPAKLIKKPKASAVKSPSVGNPVSNKPHFFEPMKARLMEAAPTGEWIYEIKFDGFRALALMQRREVQLLSRNEKDFATKFPEVFNALKGIAAADAILDGEIVALDKKGRSSFQLLQAYELGEEHPPLFYYVFDLLRLNGRDLRSEALEVRKDLLATLLKKAPDIIRFSSSLEGSSAKLLKQAAKLGLEGLIGKRKGSVYETGRRSGAWIKLKLHHEQEMVIGGYTDPEGSREHFGALLLGYQSKDGLRFAGKVGTGFDAALLDKLHKQFRPITTTFCPFTNLPEPSVRNHRQGVTASEMRKCHWLEPKLVGQVKFSEWTRDGKLRQPVFLGLREDKDASVVVRETPS